MHKKRVTGFATVQGGCTTTQVGWKVTIEVTIHDVILQLRPNGVGDRHLRRDLWARFGKIYCQASISEPDLGGIVEFKFTRQYKLQGATQQEKLGHLRIEQLYNPRSLSRALFDLCRALIKPLSM